MNVIDIVPVRTREKFLSGALQPVQHLLPAALIEQWCRELGYTWRERCWGPVVTVLACVWKQAQATASCREVEDWAASLTGADSAAARDGRDFCAARQRLPVEILMRSSHYLAAHAAERMAWFFHGLHVSIVDGTCLRAPRSKENVAAFGFSRNKHAQSRLPLVRMLARVCAGSGAMLDTICGQYAMSEMSLFRFFLERIERDVLLLLDRGFSSFMVLWLAREKSCHVLAHHHQTRKGTFARRLGSGDEIRIWKRPQQCRTTWADLWDKTPAQIEVRVIERTIRRRGYRPWILKLATTLLDAHKYPADELVSWYLQRWHIELDFRALKVELEQTRLTGQTPQIVEKEIYSALAAYNAARALMAHSGAEPRRLSLERTRVLLLQFSERMAASATVRLPGMFRTLCKLIGAAKQISRNRPPEPRYVLQRPTHYQGLTISRDRWRKKYLAA